MMTSNSRLSIALQAILFAACGRSSPATCDSGLTAPGCNRPATILTAVTPDSAAISVGETIRIKHSVTYNPTESLMRIVSHRPRYRNAVKMARRCRRR